MNRLVVAMTCSACVLALAGCSSGLPTLSLGGGELTVRMESEPPGADARASTGQGCRTPCSFTVAQTKEFTVTFTLPGYVSQTVPVTLESSGGTFGGGIGAQYTPNPVFVALEAAPPPVVKKKLRPRPRPEAKAPPPASPAPQPAAPVEPAGPRQIPGSVPTAPPAAAWPPLQR